MTLLHPNRIPKQLNSDMSNLCARRFTLVRILLSWSETPAGTALRCVFLPNACLCNLVAGTCSNCGSCSMHSLLVVLLYTSAMRRSTSNPKLLSSDSFRIYFATTEAMLVDQKSLSHRRIRIGYVFSFWSMEKMLWSVIILKLGFGHQPHRYVTRF